MPKWAKAGPAQLLLPWSPPRLTQKIGPTPLDSGWHSSSRRMPIRRLSTHGTGINIARRCRPRGNPRCIRSLLFSLATATRDTAKRSTNVLWAPRRHCVRLWLARSSVEWLWLAPRRHMSGRSRIGINDDKRLRKHLPGLVGYCRGFYSSLPWKSRGERHRYHRVFDFPS